MFATVKTFVVSRIRRNGKVLTKPEQYAPYYSV